MKRLNILMTVIGLMIHMASLACTSVIISGKASADGRPLMWKHRDTGFLDNRLEYFNGEKYRFIGLVNSSEGELGKEVWVGSNTAGFSIMNTASYCLNYDDVPSSQMDREGVVMHRALEICATLSDFEHFLDTLSRPMGVEANFGCIDASGGAAYYETSNYGYVKRDVNEMEEGYCVVTNFSVTGRKEDWKGVERFHTASDIFKRQKMDQGRFERMDACTIMDSLSRSYEHQGDKLYIQRYITSCSVVIHGVDKGGDPSHTVLWTALGYPSTSVMVPVPLSADDHIPAMMKRRSENENSLLCDLSLQLKKNVFPEGRQGAEDISKAEEYVNAFKEVEKDIADDFNIIYRKYLTGRIKEEKYLKLYDRMVGKHLETVRLVSEKLL